MAFYPSLAGMSSHAHQQAWAAGPSPNLAVGPLSPFLPDEQRWGGNRTDLALPNIYGWRHFHGLRLSLLAAEAHKELDQLVDDHQAERHRDTDHPLTAGE